MLAEDRTWRGWSVEQAARRLGVSQAIYRPPAPDLGSSLG
jgi:hypothetical protein